MINTVGEYLQSRNECEKARLELKELSDTMSRAANQLSIKPERFVFTNVCGIKLPVDAFGGVEINARKWYNAEEIMEMLRNFHFHLIRHKELYARLDTVERGNVMPPVGTEPRQ